MASAPIAPKSFTQPYSSPPKGIERDNHTLDCFPNTAVRHRNRILWASHVEAKESGAVLEGRRVAHRDDFVWSTGSGDFGRFSR